MDRAHELKQRVMSMVDAEVKRCRAALGPDAWRDHGDWVVENVAASAREWLILQASGGRL